MSSEKKRKRRDSDVPAETPEQPDKAERKRLKRLKKEKLKASATKEAVPANDTTLQDVKPDRTPTLMEEVEKGVEVDALNGSSTKKKKKKKKTTENEDHVEQTVTPDRGVEKDGNEEVVNGSSSAKKKREKREKDITGGVTVARMGTGYVEMAVNEVPALVSPIATRKLCYTIFSVATNLDLCIQNEYGY